MKKETWKTIIQIAVSILSAALTRHYELHGSRPDYTLTMIRTY